MPDPGIQRLEASPSGGEGEGQIHYGQARGKLLVRTTLPLPPTTNNLYGNKIVTSKKFDDNGNRKLYSVRFLGQDGEEYHKLVSDRLIELRAFHQFANRVGYRMVVCPSNRGRSDISNRIKVLEDALKLGGLFIDDEQVDEIWVRRGPIVTGGIVRISLWEVFPDYNANLRWVEG